MTRQEPKRESSVIKNEVSLLENIKVIGIGSRRMERYLRAKKEGLEQLKVSLNDNSKFDEKMVKILHKIIRETEELHSIECRLGKIKIILSEELIRSFMMPSDETSEDLVNEKRAFLKHLIKLDLIGITSNVTIN